MARSNQRFPARSHRSSIWNDGPGDEAVTGFSASGSAVFGLGQASLGGNTVVRIRGNLEAVLTAAAAAGQGYHVGLGIGIVSTDAFVDIGITALPDPLDDKGYPWMYHRIFDVHAVTATIADGSNNNVVRFEVDTKAMRKMKPAETLCMIAQVVEIGAATVNLHFDSCMLIKLG